MEQISTKNLINEALKYERLGFSVIPLGEISKDSEGHKTIDFMGGWKKYQTTRATPEEINKWTCKNIGLVTGKISGIFVLDADSYKKGYDPAFVKSLGIPRTPYQKTASGGIQIFLKYPEGIEIKNAVCIGKKDSGIDIRANGGVVICSPSVTSYGLYEWEISPFETELAEIPPKLLELLTARNEPSSDLIGLEEGEGRNNAMTSFVGKMMATTPADKWETDVWKSVLEINATFEPPLHPAELRKIYNSVEKMEQSKQPKSIVRNAMPYLPAISHEELMAKVFPPARFAVAPFFEMGTLNMVSAPPNQWKSWLLLLFAHNIALGTPVFGKFSTEKSNVIIVNEEDSERSIQDRLRVLGIDGRDLPIYYHISRGSKLDDRFVKKLITEAQEKNAGVIMFDSLRAIHNEEENDSTAMQSVMDLLKQITREGITVIFTHHNRKKSGFEKGGNPEATRGSTAINAAVSGHIALEEEMRDGHEVLIVSHLKSKVCQKLYPIEVSIKDPTGKIDFQYLGEQKPKGSAPKEASSKILTLLNENDGVWYGAKDFVELKIGSDNTVKEAIKQLVKENKICVTLRNKTKNTNLNLYSEDGAHNEKLYSLNDEDS
jgi:hypothetical protein